MKKFFILLTFVFGSGICHAFDGTFEEAAKKTNPTRIKVFPMKGDPMMLVISWTNLGTEPETGTMMFKGTKGSNRNEYFAIGGGGPFTLIEEGRSISLIVENPDDRRYMAWQEKEKPTLVEVMGEYQQAQGMGTMAQDKAAIETNLDKALKKFNADCGANAKKDVNWGGFKTMALANMGGGAMLGLADLCKDADTKKALSKISKFTVSFNGGANDLAFNMAGNTIEIKVQEKGYNPRERAAQWAQKAL